MTLGLEIFAPVDLDVTFFPSSATEKLKRHLNSKGWLDTDLPKAIGIENEFRVHHASFQLAITDRVNQMPDLALGKTDGVAEFSKVELLLYSTGILLVTCTYKISAAATSEEARNAYQRLSSADGHFVLLFNWVDANLVAQFRGKLPESDYKLMRRASPHRQLPHWTHGIYLHLASSKEALLSNDDLKQLARSRGDVEVHETPQASLRTALSWERTAISTTSNDEAMNATILVKMVGYIWELHWTIDVFAWRKISEVSDPGVHGTLRWVRDFRWCASTLLDSCQIARLTMVERYHHLIRSTKDQWQFSDLSTSIGRTTELLNLIYTQMTDESRRRAEQRFTGFLAILSIFTLISVTTDAVKFLVEDFGLPYWVKWLCLVVPTALAIFALVLIVFGKSRDHSR